ncbi:endonuclease/exonuclease/phosphatase family protein [Candidatus Woesebacteria bacterium]|nr:endonuclease/exonuclease/phosphatase family protein [Candidatus Woesebacteria bacterium]
MKIIRIFITSAIFLLVILFYTSFLIQAAPSVVRVISFNIGAFTIEKHFLDSRIEPIVRYLAKGNYDIIALQETHYGRKEGERIASKLEEIGAGKFYVAKAADPKSDTDVERPGPGVYILSKYPFNSVDDAFHLKTIGRAVKATIKTPHGSMHVVSTHPSATTACTETVNILNDLAALPVEIKNNLLVLGDINAVIKDIDKNPQLVGVKGYGCRGSYDLNSFNNNCDDMNACDRPDKTIDWIFTSTQNNWKVKTKSLLRNMAQEIGIPGSGWQDDLHIPIEAEVYSINPSMKQGDLDFNNEVNIFDYNILLGKFGATGAPGFHAADIIQNGAVDIFDYNKLIENFGK